MLLVSTLMASSCYEMWSPSQRSRPVSGFPVPENLLGSVVFTDCNQELERHPEAHPSALWAADPISSLQAIAADDFSLPWQVVRLTWWAVCRDSVYYTLSVIVLIAVSLSSQAKCWVCQGPVRAWVPACLSRLYDQRDHRTNSGMCLSISPCLHWPLTHPPTLCPF